MELSALGSWRDVTCFSSSGSIIAVAGYSSNGANVVIWDTLAPRATSRASILCHEGGALSLSVFDNDIGNGSISPLIVTGGKCGDVGLHDFRYIATGKAKRQRCADNIEQSSNKSLNSDKDPNVNGMLWECHKNSYHPKYQLVFDWKRRWRCQTLGCPEHNFNTSLVKIT